MEVDMKRKNERLESLLAEKQCLKQRVQVQEKQVAELEQALEGADLILLCPFGIRVCFIIVKAKVMNSLCFDLDRKCDIEKRQLTKQAKHAQMLSDILFPISGQSRVYNHI